jgi:hypothetical protein
MPQRDTHSIHPHVPKQFLKTYRCAQTLPAMNARHANRSMKPGRRLRVAKMRAKHRGPRAISEKH